MKLSSARALSLAVAMLMLAASVLCQAGTWCGGGLSDAVSGDLSIGHHSADEDDDGDDADYPDSDMCGYETYSDVMCNSYTGWEDVYSASSIGYWSGEYLPGFGVWAYCFKMTGIGNSTDDIIHVAAIEIQSTSNGDCMVLDTIDDSRYLWSTPESTLSDDTMDVSVMLVGLAMSAVASVGASIAWSVASDLISSLGGGVDDSVTRDNYSWRLWEWSPDECDVSQTAMFLVLVDPGETVSFSAEYMLFGYGYEYVSGGCYEIEITAPSATEAEGTDVDIGGANGAAAVVTADIGESSEYSGLLSLVEESDIYDDTVYTDANPQIAITVSDPTAALSSGIGDSGGLLEACMAQISRSAKIVSAFSVGEVTARDAEVAERNQALIDSLETVVDSLAAGGSEGFDRLYAEYLAMTAGGVVPDGVLELCIRRRRKRCGEALGTRIAHRGIQRGSCRHARAAT